MRGGEEWGSGHRRGSAPQQEGVSLGLGVVSGARWAGLLGTEGEGRDGDRRARAAEVSLRQGQPCVVVPRGGLPPGAGWSHREGAEDRAGEMTAR